MRGVVLVGIRSPTLPWYPRVSLSPGSNGRPAASRRHTATATRGHMSTRRNWKAQDAVKWARHARSAQSGDAGGAVQYASTE